MKLFKRLSISAAAVAFMGVAIIGSGYVSPVMGETLKQIPVLSGIYNFWGKYNGDPGIQQADEYIMSVNQTVTQDGLTMQIPSVLFDGTRILMEMETPGHELHIDPTSIDSPLTKGYVEDIKVLYKGQHVGLVSYAVIEETPTKLIMEISTSYAGDVSNTIQFPEKFDLTVDVQLKGYETPFQFHVPVTKITKNTVLASKDTKSHDNINLKINKLEMTPITTELIINYTANKGKSIEDTFTSVPAKYKHESGGFLILAYDIVDDQDVNLKHVGHYSLNNPEKVVLKFEPFKTMPKSVKIKPYLMLSEGETPAGATGRVEVTNIDKAYIPELEFTLPVK